MAHRLISLTPPLFFHFTLPLKKRNDMFSEGNAAHPVGCDSPCIVIANWRTF
jgi:hypothetical protein